MREVGGVVGGVDPEAVLGSERLDGRDRVRDRQVDETHRLREDQDAEAFAGARRVHPSLPCTEPSRPLACFLAG